MTRITCEACGHSNPEGTVLCESCGNPLGKAEKLDENGNESKSLLNMRYEGSARRSQTHNKSIVDKIWNFFSSVKVGVALIVITLIASAVGTIFPQEMYIPPTVDPAEHYRDRYGILGQVYYQLGFHNLYSSWWYMLLIAMIGISIIIASIDRVVPLHRALKMQKPKKNVRFLSRQRLFGISSQVSEQDRKTMVDKLKKQRYRITEEDGHVLAEKGRFSRWGPYVNHTGLIIFLIGAMLRFLPAMYIDDFVWVREGETTVIPQTDHKYFLENKDFIMETYDENDEKFKESLEKQGPVVSNYQTDVVLYENKSENTVGLEPELEKIKEDSIQVNKPLKFDGYALYQSSYQLNEFSAMSFRIHQSDDEEETAVDSFTVDLTDPEYEYELENGFRVVIDQYFPDYVLEDSVPVSQTKYPRNPAFVFFVYPPGEEEPEVSFAGIGRNIDPSGENEYKVALDGFQVRDVTGLTVRKDYTLPILAVGGLIFMIGVIQGMYWQHRRVWIHPQDGDLLIAAHTNKNWFGVTRDIEKAIEGTKISVPEDQEEKKE